MFVYREIPHEELFPEWILPASPAGDVSTWARGSVASLCGSFLPLGGELSWNRWVSENSWEDWYHNVNIVPEIDFSEPVPLPVIDASSLPVWEWVVPWSENK